jgi:hypothetical protein
MSDEQAEIQESVETIENSDSAPEQSQEKGVKEDGFQKRVNKITAEKYAEKRRADELEKQLNDLKSKLPNDGGTPKLEDFDYDDGEYQQALIDAKVEAAVKAQEDRRRAEESKRNAETIQEGFNTRIVAFGKDDFAEVADSIPDLPPGVADALIQAENGPELIYHLGTHLDLADKIANMPPGQAMMELGRISANISKPEPEISSAPDPIKPLATGGSLPAERGPAGATYS